jgi:hypothetical protein
MNRFLALTFAAIGACATVSAAALPDTGGPIRFTLNREGGSSPMLHARFREDSRGTNHDEWSSGFAPSDLVGLEVSSFHGSGTRPLHFSIIREAGRLDCAGSGGNDSASGDCRFAENSAFSQLLVSRGIGRPDRRQAFALMAINARRELIDALAGAHYPTPTIENVIALSALGVNGAYIGQMARVGYRPDSIHQLIEYKALGITPQWIARFARVGYASLPGNGLVQMRALGITPEFIAGYQQIGYRNLPVNTLVQLRALDITPDFVRSAIGHPAKLPSVDELVQLKLFGRHH